MHGDQRGTTPRELHQDGWEALKHRVSCSPDKSGGESESGRPNQKSVVKADGSVSRTLANSSKIIFLLKFSSGGSLICWGWEAEGSRFEPQRRENMEGILVVRPEQLHSIAGGTLEQGTEATNSHIGPCDELGHPGVDPDLGPYVRPPHERDKAVQKISSTEKVRRLDSPLLACSYFLICENCQTSI